MTQEMQVSTRVLVIVAPSFNMAATMAFIDPFRAANYLDGKPYFKWDFVSEAGGFCVSSNGAGIETQPLDALSFTEADIVIVSSSWTPERHLTSKLGTTLRQLARSGATLGALDTGAFILAQAGLLNGRRATVHYEHIDALQELYPGIEVVENLYVMDGNRLTCCGGSAATDFGLQILQGIHGSALANAAARYVFHDRLRGPSEQQQPQRTEPLGTTVPAKLKTAIQVMEANLEEPISVPQICKRAGISHRQLDRLFATYIKKTPALYYRDIRLDRARGLVTQTELPIAEVALASGFSSPVHFSRAYKERFGLPPTRDRVEGRVPFEFRAWPMHRKPKD
ncbi:helix-turn-helix domain-containing protein [Ruegeria sp. HKCCD4884]|uniref:GlxA family transcriptional regulator n=1 Tax=Ruegeria sp. HKCCD4884 TaxID=2683022 RepID=UPI0019F1FAE8|nr:GlxA family transcriptional regulator [Ruegeria sp. HKCCD4884]NOD93953.1 helix-turn-helix domain-containing protein [Ruegeria sp. HKCCD4884]